MSPSHLLHSRSLGRLAAAALVAATMLVAGCAAETGGYPKMTDFSRITQKVLSPKEQEQAIEAMSSEQKAEQAKAIKAIEKH